MPLYTFHCEEDGVFELLLPMAESNREGAECPDCGTIGHRVAEICSMRPDSMWAGHVVEGYGYVTSASKLAKIKKAKNHVELNGRNDVESMKKMAEQGRKDRETKLDKDIKDAFEEGFAGSGAVDSFGAPAPGIFDKISDEQILRGDDPRIS